MNAICTISKTKMITDEAVLCLMFLNLIFNYYLLYFVKNKITTKRAISVSTFM